VCVSEQSIDSALGRLQVGKVRFQFTLEIHPVLETIAIILLVLWALGLVSSYTLGGFIHILLVAAIVVILIRVVQGRRV
jgi:hypothetical protein